MSLQTKFQQLKTTLEHQIIGQSHLIDSLLISLLADGHLLVEGAPGLAKTKAIEALSKQVEGKFKRIQFTPDLLPGDITGTDIYRPQEQRFDFQAGPIFNNLILADEINRAPAKVQSALLEAMAERQVSAGGETRKLDELFLVMATQNPLEQEGTYPLPEAQLDRFLMQVNIAYPDAQSELAILRLARGEAMKKAVKTELKLSQEELFNARNACLEQHMSESIEQYIVQIVMATRKPQAYSEELAGFIENGASPRASLALERCARAKSFLEGRDFVTPDDVQSIAKDVLRHRLLLSFEALASGQTADSVIDEIINQVAVI